MNRMSRLFILAALIAVGGACTVANAHHSAAMYDASKTQDVTGTLKIAQIGNPHSIFWIAVPNTSGGTDLWSFEGGSVAQVVRDGTNPSEYFAVGQKVKVTYHPLRDGRPSGELISIDFGDGRVFSSVSGASAPAPASAASSGASSN